MAEKRNIGFVDANAMYNIGYSATTKGKGYQEERSKLITGALTKLGGMIFDKVSNNYKTLSGLRNSADTAGGIMDDSLLMLDNQESRLSVSGRENLFKWQGELDDALKQQALSFSPKKRRAAKKDAADIYKKMNTMKSNLAYLSAQKKIDVGRGLKSIGENHKMGDNFEGWNEGMTTGEFEMSTMLAGGTLTNYMTVDPSTGNIVLNEESKRSRANLREDGFSEGEIDQMIESGGGVTPVTTNLKDIKFAPAADKSVSTYQIGGIENAMKHGASGGEWDGNYASIRTADIANFLDTAPANAVRSAYFSKTGFGADGMMSGNSPAHDLLVSQGYNPNSVEWLAAMEIEKAKTFEIGSKERNEIGASLLAGEKTYYENSKKKYDENNPVDDKRANFMVNGGLMNPTDYNAAYGDNSDFTTFLNSETALSEEEAEEMVTPGGFEYQRRFDGIYQLTATDDKGKKVYDKKVTANEVKRNEKLPGVTRSIIPLVNEGGGDGGGGEGDGETPNSADFAYDVNVSNVLSGWNKRYEGMGFKYTKSKPGVNPRATTITITADNGATHVTKLRSRGGNKQDQAKALNKFIEENKI